MVSLKVCSGFPQCPLPWPITPLVKVEVPYVQASVLKSGQHEGKCPESKVWLRELGIRPSYVSHLCGGFPGSSPHCLSHRTLSFLPSLELLGYWWLSPVLQPSVLFLFPMCPGDSLHIANFFIQCILQISSAYCNFPLHISFLKILLGGGIPWWSSG